jgi:hypothetical protein
MRFLPDCRDDARTDSLERLDGFVSYAHLNEGPACLDVGYNDTNINLRTVLDLHVRLSTSRYAPTTLEHLLQSLVNLG